LPVLINWKMLPVCVPTVEAPRFKVPVLATYALPVVPVFTVRVEALVFIAAPALSIEGPAIPMLPLMVVKLTVGADKVLLEPAANIFELADKLIVLAAVWALFPIWMPPLVVVRWKIPPPVPVPEASELLMVRA
jgi:hypothetical protein